MNQTPRIVATYRVSVAPDAVERVARFIAYEQTVELPESLVRDPYLLSEVVGEVLDIAAEPARESFIVRVAYSVALVSRQLGQLINLLYGNVSMYAGIRLLDVVLPEAVLAMFKGPRYGIEGLRALLGVHGRPLLSTAVKPRGLRDEQLAAIVRDFALGGGDIVKDDQNLVSESFEAFKTRVSACADAVDVANARTGRACLYLPHLAAPHAELDRYAEFIARRGLRGVLLCPMVMGPDTARDLAERFGFLYMAHPTLTGTYTNNDTLGISHRLLLGMLLRLGGADISVFTAPGGRFAYTQAQCDEIAQAMREPLGALRPGWPSPGGGMRFDLLKQLCQIYGNDAVFLVGGDLLGYSNDLVASTRAFLAEIRAHANERLSAPAL